MNLPKKDKHGVSILSYSQIATFKKSKADFYDRYILQKPFEGNEYTYFGLKVGEALEKNDFSLFSDPEKTILKQVTRLHEFERSVFLEYKDHGFYLVGYIDTISEDFTRIIDYKTGGLGKEKQYSDTEYNQLHIYALAIKQDLGLDVKDASVEFIRRGGNAYRGQKLFVKDEKPIVIPQDLSEERLKHVYWDILKTAKEIEKFYKENKY